MFKYYTADYEGEMLIKETTWKDRRKTEDKVWLSKTIINEEHNGIAHIIGNGPSRKNFDLGLLHGQKGGEGGVQPIGQTYGCNLLFVDFTPTFLICYNKFLCAEIAESKYCKDNIVYTNQRQITNHPEHFHLYPHFKPNNAGTLAAWLACADGHKEVYLLGFDFYETGKENIYYKQRPCYDFAAEAEGCNAKWIKGLANLLNLYDDVSFYRVVEHKKAPMPDELLWLDNLKQITYLEYVNRCSIGAIAH